MPKSNPSAIADDEQLTFFPTIALPNGDGITVPIHGWIYEPSDNKLLRSRLSSALRIKRELTATERQRFGERFRWFTADSEN